MPLEIACFNVPSAITAANVSADRIELCANGHLGGTTPSLSSFKAFKESRSTLPAAARSIPVNVMIRPRGGNFVCTREEIETMESSISEFLGVEGGPDGFVFGLLTPTGEVDVEGCRRLVLLANGRPCTFHRAFDAIPVSKRFDAVEVILDLGFKAILTSGGAPDAVSGKEVLKELVGRVEGRGCEIIVGGGVRSTNLEGLRRGVGARWWHSSADVRGEGSADGEEVRKLVAMVERDDGDVGN